MYFNKCPRCGDSAFENLATHSHCFACNYSPEEQSRHYEVSTHGKSRRGDVFDYGYTPETFKSYHSNLIPLPGINL